ncbi:MAG: kynureninase [Candidatus Latescibacteria bacterium]|nr:kynureninase [Candidatus Latescibacterota bacterium]
MSNAPYENTRAFALACDERDPLASFRDKFHLPKQASGDAYLYFVGHSLGLQPRTARGYVEQELKDWEMLAVEGHFKGKNPWMPYHEYLTDQLATIVGGQPGEVVAMNTLTVNLHLMMVSFYRPTPERHKILIEGTAFPSDKYAVASQAAFHGYDAAESVIQLDPRAGEDTIRAEDIEELLEREGGSIALIMLGGVNYLTGQAFDMARITELGHRHGCTVGFDLAHAAGNLILNLHDWDVDFAVWCSYKYLNGGPGCVGGAFVHGRHAESDLPRFAGWWGQDKQTRFAMPSGFTATPGAEGWQLSNPPILPLASLRASLEIFEAAGLAQLRKKSESLTGYLAFLLQETVGEHITLITPADKAQRGAQLSFRVKRDGASVYERISASGVLCDWREPDVIRVAPIPLYTSFEDVHQFVSLFGKAVKAR